VKFAKETEQFAKATKLGLFVKEQFKKKPTMFGKKDRAIQGVY